MKIGIVTQALANNYGGLLQNYALQQVLKKLGHDVKTIDYVYRLSYTRYLLSVCKQTLLAIVKLKRPELKSYVAMPKHRIPIMADFVNRHIEKTQIVHSYRTDIISKEQFNAIITGSDQVWRPKYNEYIEDMYLKFVPDDICKVAYAASFGVDSWEYNPKQTKSCAKLAQRFNAISVREISGVQLCNENLGVDAECVLDPTILAGAQAYKPLIRKNQDGDYLFAYILDITDDKRASVETIAKSRGLKTIIRSAGRSADLSPEEWLSMIAHASMVITDSFHGTVFSILFHREFLSIVNKSRGGTRFASLLVPLGLESRMGDMAQLRFTQQCVIDWKQVDNNLAIQREKSMNYLTKALG